VPCWRSKLLLIGLHPLCPLPVETRHRDLLWHSSTAGLPSQGNSQVPCAFIFLLPDITSSSYLEFTPHGVTSNHTTKPRP
jgi:hypothetical protein